MTVTKPTKAATTWKARTIYRIRSKLDAGRVLDLKQSPFSVM